MNENAKEWISKLSLKSHPEGGYYREIYRSATEFDNGENLRTLSTSIYFLLNELEKSHFHQLSSDEIWYFHAGAPCKIHMIHANGDYETQLLGLDILKDESPQIIIPKGTTFAAEVTDKFSYTLMSCMVSPGFDFADFKLFSEEELSSIFPQHKDIITEFTLR